MRGEPAWAFAYVVVPVLGHLFAAGEVGYVRVAAQRHGGTDEVRLHIDALGDSGIMVIWDSASPLRGKSLVKLRMHLADQLQDLIAESPQGWGQLRAFARSDFE